VIAAVLLRAVRDIEGGPAAPFVLDTATMVALNQGLVWRRGVPGSRLVGVACGPVAWEAALREALALGLDAVTRAEDSGPECGSVKETATALVAALPPGAVAVFAGASASDFGSGALPGAIAALLDLPLLAEVIAVEAGEAQVIARVRAGAGRHLAVRVAGGAVYVAANLPRPPLYPPLARRLAAQRTPIAVAGPYPGPLAPELELAGYGPARPRTRRLLKPDSSARSGERLKQLMAGGMTNRPGSVIRSESESVAWTLVDLLEKEGLLPPPPPRHADFSVGAEGFERSTS